MRGPGEQTSIAENVVYYRRRRGITQEVLGDLVGRSGDWVRRVENGHLPLDRYALMGQVARALDIEVTELTGGPRLADRAVDRRRGMPALRQVVYALAVQPADTIISRPVAEPQLRSDVAALWAGYQQARFRAVTAQLTTVLPSACAYAELVGDADQTVAWGHVAMSYQAAAMTLTKLGETDLAWACSERGVAAAQRSSSPLVVGSLLRSLAHSLMSTGQHGGALDVADRAIRRLTTEAAVSTPGHVSIIGSLLLVAAMAAARAEDPATARSMLDRAAGYADQLRYDANHVWTAFGPTNVAIHRVSIAVELGETQVAAQLAPRIDASGLPIERRVRHALELARIYTRTGDSLSALGVVLAAEAEAPEQVRHHYLGRELVLGWARSRSLGGDLRVQRLADRMNVV